MKQTNEETKQTKQTNEETIGSPEWLPQGWSVESKIGEKGKKRKVLVKLISYLIIFITSVPPFAIYSDHIMYDHFFSLVSSSVRQRIMVIIIYVCVKGLYSATLLPFCLPFL